MYSVPLDVLSMSHAALELAATATANITRFARKYLYVIFL
jgi:hypothetical protein